eukprot:252057-Rhodomonas_salina.4
MRSCTARWFTFRAQSSEVPPSLSRAAGSAFMSSSNSTTAARPTFECAASVRVDAIDLGLVLEQPLHLCAVAGRSCLRQQACRLVPGGSCSLLSAPPSPAPALSSARSREGHCHPPAPNSSSPSKGS